MAEIEHDEIIGAVVFQLAPFADAFIGQFIFIVSLVDDDEELGEGVEFFFFVLFAEEIGFPVIDFSAQIGIFFDALQDFVARSSFADEP